MLAQTWYGDGKWTLQINVITLTFFFFFLLFLFLKRFHDYNAERVWLSTSKCSDCTLFEKEGTFFSVVDHLRRRAGLHRVTSSKSHSCQQVSTWRQSPNFWASKTNKIWIYLHWNQILIIVCNLKNYELVLRVWSSFLLNPTLNTNPKPHLQQMLPCRHSCHTWDLGLGTMCEVASPNCHALNGWDCTDWP